MKVEEITQSHGNKKKKPLQGDPDPTRNKMEGSAKNEDSRSRKVMTGKKR